MYRTRQAAAPKGLVVESLGKLNRVEENDIFLAQYTEYFCRISKPTFLTFFLKELNLICNHKTQCRKSFVGALPLQEITFSAAPELHNCS